MPQEFIATVVTRERLGAANVLTTYAVPANVLSGATAGQFIMARCGTTHDPLLRRPYSPVSWDPRTGAMTLLILRGGQASRWLADREPGDRVEMLGLLGSGFTVAPTTRRALLIGGGVGIAPLIALAEHALARGVSVTLLAGVATAAGLLPPGQVPAEVEYVIATADGSAGHHGFVTDLVTPYLDWADQIYACGPNPMFLSLARVMRQHGPVELLPPAQFSIEEYMACGLGVCMGCVTDTKHGPQRVCKEGPVFDWRELAWV
ncbi:MAG: dihydroorotate dehydrogenase electron transfer subunit [Chloroflexi bacterium]|nr:dihydroorotate dehydrogenase electron transfer subunit [Chloroflexota bacterium]